MDESTLRYGSAAWWIAGCILHPLDALKLAWHCRGLPFVYVRYLWLKVAMRLRVAWLNRGLDDD